MLNSVNCHLHLLSYFNLDSANINCSSTTIIQVDAHRFQVNVLLEYCND
jgi:hypothetical protein